MPLSSNNLNDVQERFVKLAEKILAEKELLFTLFTKLGNGFYLF